MSMLLSPHVFGALDPVVAVGTANTPDAAGALIPLSTIGAAVDDMLVVHSPYGQTSPAGTGWNSYLFDWFFSEGEPYYHGALWWKKISSTADILVPVSYGVAYMLYRGANTLSPFGDTESASNGATSVTLTLATPGATALMQGVFTAQQGGADPTPPAGYVDRIGALTNSTFMQGLMTDSTPTTGDVTVTTVGGGGAFTPCHTQGFELRS